MLLNEAIKIDADEKLQLISIVSVPHMKDVDRKAMIKQYKLISDRGERVSEEDIKRNRKLLLKKIHKSMI